MKPAVLLLSALVFFISFSVAGSETTKLAAECEANKDWRYVRLTLQA